MGREKPAFRPVIGIKMASTFTWALGLTVADQSLFLEATCPQAHPEYGKLSRASCNEP